MNQQTGQQKRDIIKINLTNKCVNFVQNQKRARAREREREGKIRQFLIESNLNCKQTVEVTRHFEEQLEVEVTAKVMVSLIALTKPQTILFN